MQLCTTIFSIEGHTVDMPVSNPFLTDKLIDEELKQMMDMQVSEKRMGCVLRIHSRKEIVLVKTNIVFFLKQI